MMSDKGPTIAAVILAGGRGERMGNVVKANLVVGGRRLLDRVAAALSDVGVALVAVGGFGPLDIPLAPGQIAVPDLATNYAGPLAGLAAAVAWSMAQQHPPDLLLSAAVDTPFLPHNFANAMAAAIEPGHDAVVAKYGAQDYPTNAIWRLTRIADLPSRMAAGTAPRSLRRLATEVGSATLSWPDSDGGNPFANANTPAELAELESRAEALMISSAIGQSGLGNAGQTR
jgi:molybdopterin-guanine dinucleotide biosynthesis protein A